MHIGLGVKALQFGNFVKVVGGSAHSMHASDPAEVVSVHHHLASRLAAIYCADGRSIAAFRTGVLQTELPAFGQCCPSW